MSSRRLREKKIRQEAIAKHEAEKRLKEQLQTKIDTMRRNLPDIPEDIAKKVALMQIDLENKGADSLQPLRNIADPSPDRLHIVPQATQKKKRTTIEEFLESFKNKMGRF